MVSSTASPMAMLAMRLVIMESSIPSHPMTPKVMMMGKRFGTMATSPTLPERKSRNMIPKTSTMVSDRLLTWPLVIRWLLAEMTMPNPVTSQEIFSPNRVRRWSFDSAAGGQKVPGTGQVGEQQQVDLPEIRTDKPFEQVFAQNHAKAVDQHAQFPVRLGQPVVLGIEPVGGVVDQFEIVGIGDDLVDAGKGLQEDLQRLDPGDAFGAFKKIVRFGAGQGHIEGKGSGKVLVDVVEMTADRGVRL